MMDPQISFSESFSPAKVARILPLLPETLLAIRELTGFDGKWPRVVESMTAREIREGERRGKGHGLYYHDGRRVKVNASMSWRGIYLNVIHELFHHASPQLSDREINDVCVPWVWFRVTGRKLRGWAKWKGTR